MGDMKERIALTALRLFSQNGYEAVSMRDIAEAVGVTAGALYKHYAGKRDIFDAILARMERRDAEQAREHALPEAPPEAGEEPYRAASAAQLVAFSRQMFRYWTQDAFAAQFRRMLTLEQFRSREMGALYQQYLGAGPLGYVVDLLSALGVREPETAAVRLYAPMFLLYSVYDAAEDKAAVLSRMDAILDSALAELTNP